MLIFDIYIYNLCIGFQISEYFGRQTSKPYSKNKELEKALFERHIFSISRTLGKKADFWKEFLTFEHFKALSRVTSYQVAVLSEV